MQHAPRMEPDDIQDLSEPILFPLAVKRATATKGTLLNTSLNLASCLCLRSAPRTENKCRDLLRVHRFIRMPERYYLPGCSVGPALLNSHINASRTGQESLLPRSQSFAVPGPASPSFPKSDTSRASARPVIKITSRASLEELAARLRNPKHNRAGSSFPTKRAIDLICLWIWMPNRGG